MVDGKLERVLYFFKMKFLTGTPTTFILRYPGRPRAILFHKGGVCNACLYLMMKCLLPKDLKVSRKHELVLL